MGENGSVVRKGYASQGYCAVGLDGVCVDERRLSLGRNSSKTNPTAYHIIIELYRIGLCYYIFQDKLKLFCP